MLTALMILSMIGVIVGIFFVVFQALDISVGEGNIFYLLAAIFYWILSLMVLIHASDQVNDPTDKDVLQGRAEYIQDMHIIKGDTLNTYQLDWKK